MARVPKPPAEVQTCPECGETIFGVRHVLADYATIPNMPVYTPGVGVIDVSGYEGRRVPLSYDVTYEPCGHGFRRHVENPNFGRAT